MQAVLKSFRLPKEMADFIKNEALLNHVSEARVIERAVQKIMTQENQWQQTLQMVAMDEAFRDEEKILAEENYD